MGVLMPWIAPKSSAECSSQLLMEHLNLLQGLLELFF